MARLWPFHSVDESRPDVDEKVDEATERLLSAVTELEHYAKYVIEEQEARDDDR